MGTRYIAGKEAHGTNRMHHDTQLFKHDEYKGLFNTEAYRTKCREDSPVLWRRVGHHVRLPPPGNTPPSRECYLPIRDEYDIQDVNTGFLQQHRTQLCAGMLRHIGILCKAKTLRTQLADFETFWNCKVDTSTEFAGQSVARTVFMGNPPKV